MRVGAGGTTYGTTSEVDFVPPSEVDLMDVSPKQIVSISTALIPFIEHDDANRALMGANMQKQAVPLVYPEAPFVGTGVEGRAARDTGDVLLAEGTGTIVEVAGEHVIVDYSPGQSDRWGTTLGRKVYPVYKFRRSNQNTCFNQRIVVEEGQPVARGDVLADGPSTEGASSGWARTCSSPSCPGRATTTKTPSSCPSGSSATTSCHRSTSRSTRSTPGTPSSGRKRSLVTSPTSPKRS